LRADETDFLSGGAGGTSGTIQVPGLAMIDQRKNLVGFRPRRLFNG
jgi:hypothetical protein